MAHFGTAYIDIQPDLSAFGAGLGAQIEARLKGLGASVGDLHQKIELDIDTSPLDKLRELQSRLGKLHIGIDKRPLETTLADVSEKVKKIPIQIDPADVERLKAVTQDLREVAGTNAEAKLAIRTDQAKAELAIFQQKLSDLRREKVTPEVTLEIGRTMAKIEVLEARLAKLDHEKVEVKVDVDRSAFSFLGNFTSDIGVALRGITSAAGNLLGVGSAFSSLGSAAAAAAPLVIGLAVAVGILVASFGAAIAGAGALGIALAAALGPAAIVAFAALARIAVIIKAIHDDGTKSAATTQAVANANDQLKAATDGVANAQTNLQQQTTAAYRAWADSIEAVHADLISVESAQEGVAQASINLREAQLELKKFKADAPGLQGLFKKFTDVNVDLSGLKRALAEARKASGGKLSQEDSLKLEQLILNVRKAKTGEKQATDDLHNSNVKLQRDRQTEAGFLKRGIAAYPGYTSAVQGLASAQRQLATAQRASATAAVAQQGALAKLSPVERKLAATFSLISGAFKKAFGPALNALFGGLNQALRIFAAVLTDPKIVRALKGIGVAIGGVLVGLARAFTSRRMRDAFIELARGGAQLVKILGGRAFKDFVVILTQIAIAALPAMITLFRDLADVLDRWAKWIVTHPKQFKKDIDALVGSFLGWLGVIIDVFGFLLKVGGFLKGLGDTIGSTFRNLGDALGLNKRDVQDVSKAWDNLRTAFSAVVDALVPSLRVALRDVGAVVRGVIRIVAGLISGDWAEAWKPFGDAANAAIKVVADSLANSEKKIGRLGSAIGRAFVQDFRAAIGQIKTIARAVIGAVIDIINVGIAAIDAVIGAIPNINIPGLGHTRPGKIDPIHSPFAKKPKPNLNPGHLPLLTAAPRVALAPQAPSLDTSHDSATVQNFGDIILPPAPAAAVPDARYQARQFALAVARAGG